MRSQKMLVKIVVLSGFVLLLSGFVAFRSGAFDKYLQKKYSGLSYTDTSKKPAPDTIKPPKTIMSSSKSIIMTDYTIKPDISQLDSVEKKRLIDELIKKRAEAKAKQELYWMTSSKSGPVVRPSDLKTPDTFNTSRILINGETHLLSLTQIDSMLQQLNNDTVKSVPDTIVKPPVRIYSTKSAPVFRPADLPSSDKDKKKKKKDQ